jgi:hypothetical protein
MDGPLVSETGRYPVIRPYRFARQGPQPRGQ